MSVDNCETSELDFSKLDLISEFLCALKTISNTYSQNHLQSCGNKQSIQNSQSLCANSNSIFMSPHRPRTRSLVTIWSLPDSVLVHILKHLHIRDLLSFRSVHSYFCDIIDTNNILWKTVSFANAWPSEKNVTHFVNAAEKKNVEASVKLAVAYLYKEGICNLDSETVISSKSAHYFCLAEILTPSIFPFFWIFVRPPWSLDGECCKAKTFKQIQTIAEQMNHPDLCFGVGLTLKLLRLTSHGLSKGEEMGYFNQAVEKKSKAAAFFLLLDIEKETDTAKELERVRMLRLIADSVLEAKMFLIRHYLQGHFGGISQSMAQQYVRSCFHSSQPTRIHLTYCNGQTSDISRYILVDWLVEVLGMKEYSTHTLYLAVSMFDRFLQKRKIERNHIQLLGVAAMVISSRYLGYNILTISEAAWLTDNSYSYQAVVRMMGELVAALSGNLRVLNIHDFVMVLARLVGEKCQSAMLMEYLAMLCLLQSEMGQYSPSEIAASCLLLANILLNDANPWPTQVQEWTGFTQDYLSLCAFHIYNKCLLEGSEVDYRDTKLQAVKTRYADANRFSISKIKTIPHKELCKRLGVFKMVDRGRDAKAIKFRNTDELIMSPSRGQNDEFETMEQSCSFQFENFDRRSSATPPIDIEKSEEEAASGYDGDQEDASEESFMSKPDSDLDLWDSILEDSNDWDEDIEEEEDECELNSIAEHLKKLTDDTLGQQSANHEPCLSSMCQLGTKLSCHSTMSSSSSCVANCCCKQSSKGTFEIQTGSMSAPEMTPTTKSAMSLDLSTALPDRSQTQSSPSGASNITSQNIRSCIPCGNIGSARRSKFGKSSKKLGGSFKLKPESEARGGQPMTRSKSLQRFPSSSGCLHTNNNFTQVTSGAFHPTVVTSQRNATDNSNTYLLHVSQDNKCNHLDKFTVGQLKGSKAQVTGEHGDFLSTPNHSGSFSSFAGKAISLPITLSTPSLSSKSGHVVDIASDNCDISNTPGCSESVPKIETSQKVFCFQSFGKFGEADSFNMDKCVDKRYVHNPITPENSWDSFNALCKSNSYQAVQQLLVTDANVNTPEHGTSKKARLDFNTCILDADSDMRQDSSGKTNCDPNANNTSFSSQLSSSKYSEVGPVLRRKRKGSDSKPVDKY